MTRAPPGAPRHTEKSANANLVYALSFNRADTIPMANPEQPMAKCKLLTLQNANAVWPPDLCSVCCATSFSKLAVKPCTETNQLLQTMQWGKNCNGFRM